MADIKLVYFDIRGRAEMLRLMLEAAGQKYQDERVQFADWPQQKANAPFYYLPYIEYKGKKYTQSTAIATFFAKELGFYGKTNLDALRIDEIKWLWEDQVLSNLAKYRWTRDEDAKAEHLRQMLEVDLPKFFGIYESLLSENKGTGYFVGDSLTLADFYVYDMADNMLVLKDDALKDYPLLRKLRQNVESDPKVKAYLARRKPAFDVYPPDRWQYLPISAKVFDSR